MSSEGLAESVPAEIEPSGLHLTIGEPGFFRPDFLGASSVSFGQSPIADYESTSGSFRGYYEARNRCQAGDPAKLRVY